MGKGERGKGEGRYPEEGVENREMGRLGLFPWAPGPQGEKRRRRKGEGEKIFI